MQPHSRHSHMAQSHMQGNEKYKNRISAELQNLGLMQDSLSFADIKRMRLEVGRFTIFILECDKNFYTSI